MTFLPKWDVEEVKAKYKIYFDIGDPAVDARNENPVRIQEIYFALKKNQTRYLYYIVKNNDNFEYILMDSEIRLPTLLDEINLKWQE